MLPARMSVDDTIGATLGSYKVTAKLGQGGMGAVYLAEHPLLGRKAAVKVLLPELSSHTDSVERFFHEARTTARLRHPAMVDVFDFGTLPDGRAYLIMDYLEGECLEDRIRERGALAAPEALRFRDSGILLHSRYPRPLPLRPVWPGFAINTLFYAAILWGGWLLLAAPFALRRRRRIKRGLCPACAYPVGASDVCTECGASLQSHILLRGSRR